MSSASTAILEHKKQPFLKAFVRTGKVAPATRAARISRDAVYDWLRVDPKFRKAFQIAKRQRYDHETVVLSEALDVLLSVIKPIIPSELYPRVVAATNLTLSQRKFKDASSSTVRVSSRKEVRFTSVDVHPEKANLGNGVNRRDGKNGPYS